MRGFSRRAARWWQWHLQLPVHVASLAKRILAHKTLRLQLVTLVFGVLLLVPLTPSINLQGQLGYFSKRIAVEAYDGGILDALHVKEGQTVVAGQQLATLRELRIDGEYEAQLQQLAARLCRQQRLRAMTALSEFVSPVDAMVSDKYLSSYCTSESQLAKQQIDQFREKINLQRQQFAELQREVASIERSAQSEQQRLALHQQIHDKKSLLHESGFLSPIAFLESNKDLMESEQRVAEKRADLSVRREKLSESRRQFKDVENEFLERARSEEGALANEIAMQRERLRYLLQAHDNFQVKAPQSGVVYGLRKLREGGSLAPRDVLLEIVPNNEEMVISAVMPARESWYVVAGQDGIARLQTHNQSFAPEFKARVISVSADIKTERPNDPPSYEVLLGIDCPAECVQKNGFVSGMPTDVYVLGAKRSLLSYLLDAVFKGSRKVLSEPS